MAAFLHFFFLSSFCWVLTEAWQSYMAVTGHLRNRLIRKRFLCLGWGEWPPTLGLWPLSRPSCSSLPLASPPLSPQLPPWCLPFHWIAR